MQIRNLKFKTDLIKNPESKTSEAEQWGFKMPSVINQCIYLFRKGGFSVLMWVIYMKTCIIVSGVKHNFIFWIHLQLYVIFEEIIITVQRKAVKQGKCYRPCPRLVPEDTGLIQSIKTQIIRLLADASDLRSFWWLEVVRHTDWPFDQPSC